MNRKDPAHRIGVVAGVTAPTHGKIEGSSTEVGAGPWSLLSSSPAWASQPAPTEEHLRPALCRRRCVNRQRGVGVVPEGKCMRRAHPSSPGDSVPCTPMPSSQRNLEASPEEFLPAAFRRAGLELPFTL